VFVYIKIVRRLELSADQFFPPVITYVSVLLLHKATETERKIESCFSRVCLGLVRCDVKLLGMKMSPEVPKER
jgi:hypothetical protein